MSVGDGSRLLDDPGLRGAALQRNTGTINAIRAILAACDIPAFTGLLNKFAELVEECGPLGYLRFDAEPFDVAVREALARATEREPEALCDELHVACISSLATPAMIQMFRHELQQFLAQAFVPREHRTAACAALLTTPASAEMHGLKAQELPALYILFRMQLVGWLIARGEQQSQLMELAAALEAPPSAP